MAKSVIAAYFLWAFGGLLGLHHLYLGRDGQWFLWFSTLGGFLLGWIVEIFRIPDYVAQANRNAEYLQGWELKQGHRVREWQLERWIMAYFTAGLYEVVTYYGLTPYAPKTLLLVLEAMSRAVAIQLCFSSKLKKTKFRGTLAASLIGEALTFFLPNGSKLLTTATASLSPRTNDLCFQILAGLMALQIPFILTAGTAFYNQRFTMQSNDAMTRSPLLRWPILVTLAAFWVGLLGSALYNHVELPLIGADGSTTTKLKTVVDALYSQSPLRSLKWPLSAGSGENISESILSSTFYEIVSRLRSSFHAGEDT